MIATEGSHKSTTGRIVLDTNPKGSITLFADCMVLFSPRSFHAIYLACDATEHVRSPCKFKFGSKAQKNRFIRVVSQDNTGEMSCSSAFNINL